MKKKRSDSKPRSLSTWCTDEDADSVPPEKLFHRYEKTYSGTLFDVLTCEDCGATVKASPSW